MFSSCRETASSGSTYGPMSEEEHDQGCVPAIDTCWGTRVKSGGLVVLVQGQKNRVMNKTRGEPKMRTTYSKSLEQLILLRFRARTSGVRGDARKVHKSGFRPWAWPGSWSRNFKPAAIRGFRCGSRRSQIFRSWSERRVLWKLQRWRDWKQRRELWVLGQCCANFRTRKFGRDSQFKIKQDGEDSLRGGRRLYHVSCWWVYGGHMGLLV